MDLYPYSHRYSMPGSRSKNGIHESGLDGTNVTRFLFGDDESGYVPPIPAADERFPTLVLRDDQMSHSSHWSSHINRHRTQQSLSGLNGPSSNVGIDVGALSHRPASLRQSLDLSYISENAPDTMVNDGPVQGNNIMASPPRLPSSFSSNDVPTIRNPTGTAPLGSGPNAITHAQQHFHNHNASMGRIPAGAVPTRGHSRELSGDHGTNGNREQQQPFQSIQSALHANAAPFGPSAATSSSMANVPVMAGQIPSPTNQTPVNAFNSFYPPPNGYPQPANGNGAQSPYGINMLTAGVQQMNVNGAANSTAGYNGQNFTPNYTPPGPYNQGSQNRDSQARVIQNRRQMDNEAMSRYQNMPIESFRGQIYDLCKDQHGCRYLQKKLEERDPEHVHLIWLETNQHVIELMTDPFGNYLCQKLLEFCSDDERTVLIQNASQDMVRIALNTHGTRALQKMIEYVSTPQQVHLIIEALRFRVVELIQDLNGNHVIQKCLNKLSPPDSQFIFDAVGNNCVEVGTHRHGCCVLQRCIDHASGEQKLWLIQRITDHSRVLVQDPFGNYVVQYIIDLNQPTFTEPIVAMFQGCISQLSRHKFSSNVIEKCLRCSEALSKDMIVEEMLDQQEMERLIRDSYANYVVQTALDYATPQQKNRLVESIRPILPSIRNTPYGRRIQAKITSFDGRGSVASSGQATPADNSQGQVPLRPSGGHSRGLSTSSNAVSNGQGLDPAMKPYQNGGVAPAATSTAPGTAPVPAPFNPGAQNNVNGTAPSASQPSQGTGSPWM
ncbi:hypothetical protein GMORB2_6315 [Geosmithia morbida]|uniref:PUM-HD domain-containing protein n=1 Tax=Geosmithia morbida TaxID=1094350 RepID=A0A9P4YZ03_9HYPO|nr:uncharacterized protein GMORB2_6315 [Geosmithia morbida]KAF4123614.1 hypothetical protein GMORB2_6315 [Geosmithia morbida]